MIVVFVGPSARPEDLATILPEARFLPPAHRGDVFHAVRGGARRILLIDGYFDTVPAVWHKELLHALASDVVVYGASSIGALRAAEMERFGMIGVGEVFAAVRDGLVDDDDVAVAQDPERDGSTSRSVAMVNVRWTLRHAAGAGVIDEATRHGLDAVAKAVYYPERTYPRILHDAARAAVLDATTRERLAVWLRAHAVDIKRRDADTAARRVREDIDTNTWPAGRPVHVPTRFFHDLVGEESHREGLRGEQWSVLDELRADPSRFAEVRAAAERRRAGIELARSAGVRPDRRMIDAAAESFRRAHGLLETAALQQWLDDAGWTDEDYAAFVEREALRLWGETRLARLDSLDLLDVLHLSGEHDALVRRARARVARLDRSGLDDRVDPGDGIARRAALVRRAGFDAHAGFDGLDGLDDHALAARLGLPGVVALEGFLRVLAATTDEPRPSPM